MADPAGPDASGIPKVRLRPELEQSWQRHQDMPVLVVKDPVTRRYFRFTESQAAILALIAEPTDAEALAIVATAKLGQTVSPRATAGFLQSLEQKFLLDTPEVREKLTAMGGQKLDDRNLLYWKLTSFDPERIFDWLLPRTQWLFRPAFHVVAVALFLAAVVTFYSNWRDLSLAAPGLLSVYGFFLVLPMAFTVLTIHEFAHGLTCRHFGGKVHEVGFMLIYFQPAFYCDVSDSWLFPSTRNRMWVTFAGGYAQLIVWSICTLLWRLLSTDILISQALLAVVLFSGLQSIANFNPLIKLDGYYLLSDYLEIPNLRAKAGETLWGWISGRIPKRAGETARMIRAQLIYGGLSFLFSTLLLVWVYAALYTWSTSQYRLAGLVGFTMFSTYTLRKTAADTASGIRAFWARATVKRYRNLVILLLIALIAAFGYWELKIPAEFRVLARDEQIARAETEGILVEIIARENMEVRKGGVLARMRDFKKQQELTELGDVIAGKRNQLKLLQSPPRPEDIDRAEKLVETRRVELQNAAPNAEQRKQLEETLAGRKAALNAAEYNLERSRQLFNDQLISRREFENVESLAQVRRSDVGEAEAAVRAMSETDKRETERQARLLDEATSALQQLKAGPKPEQVQDQQTDIARLAAQYAQRDRELAKTEIRSPIDGVVITPNVERMLHQHLDVGADFCKIVDIRHVTIEMKVPEKEMADVQIAFPVWLRLRGYPAEEFGGRVDSIPLVAQVDQGLRVLLVRSEIENVLRDGRYLFKPETTGSAKIYAGQRRIADLATRSFRQWIRTEFWHYF